MTAQTISAGQVAEAFPPSRTPCGPACALDTLQAAFRDLAALLVGVLPQDRRLVMAVDDLQEAAAVAALLVPVDACPGGPARQSGVS